MQNIGAPLDPHQAAAQRGLLHRELLRVQDRAYGNVYVAAKLRVEVEPDVVIFGGCSQITDQQQRVRWFMGVADDL